MPKGTLILKQGEEVLAEGLTLKQAKAHAMRLAKATLMKWEVFDMKGRKVASAKTVVEWRRSDSEIKTPPAYRQGFVWRGSCSCRAGIRPVVAATFVKDTP